MTLWRSHWAIYFFFWTIAVVLFGAAAGAIGFVLFGPFFGSTESPLRHAIAGARHLGFIALIWAPGIALVLCVMRGYRNKQKQ
jgi:hypothetical protein